uniref:Adenylyl-sulfate kinase n=1 Tax=Chaetoceros debilis TaxID=122233 RepID=A0A7S3Q4M3_9STRA
MTAIEDTTITSNGSDKEPSTSSSYGKVQTVGKSSNIAWHHSDVTKADIHRKNNHKSTILWFTGLSGSGKSTLANAVHSQLYQRKVNSYVLDGDNVRHGLNADLGFSDDDREENIRRIGHVASLFMDAGMVVLTAFVSPFRSDRDKVRTLVNGNANGNANNNDDDSNSNEFIEVYCSADLSTCEGRDTKGLYAKARAGVIPQFTGVSSPYEAPEKAELNVLTGSRTLEECVADVIAYLETKEIIKIKL